MSVTTARDAANVESASHDSAWLKDAYLHVRKFSEQLCEPLTPEDYVVQSMPDASPTRWHLAHATWFFDRMVLRRAIPNRRTADERFDYLFNSYYNTLGDQFPRPNRGLLSRPTVDEVMDFRRRVDDEMLQLFDRSDIDGSLAGVIETGLHHEQQHQELLLTDLKHMFSCNPMRPVYRERTAPAAPSGDQSLAWVAFDEGLERIGADSAQFAYDNERPRHRVFVHAFEIASRLVTCEEYLEFMLDGGYDKAEHWLSDGWAKAQAESWKAPLYWQQTDDGWQVYTLGGVQQVHPAEPVCHLSFYEADAYARWAGARLPTEAEWEVAASTVELDGHFVEAGRYHPASHSPFDGGSIGQLFGDAWEWTRSPYVAYPGYAPPPGPLGEYNGKFMCNQMVLRGGSCATPKAHIRRTYRNFFHPHSRWQFAGLRLARDA